MAAYSLLKNLFLSLVNYLRKSVVFFAVKIVFKVYEQIAAMGLVTRTAFNH